MLDLKRECRNRKPRIHRSLCLSVIKSYLNLPSDFPSYSLTQIPLHMIPYLINLVPDNLSHTSLCTYQQIELHRDQFHQVDKYAMPLESIINEQSIFFLQVYLDQPKL